MTMPSSGAITIGQAMGECGIGGASSAGNAELSRLAGVNPGSFLAWSYWYGKSYLAPWQPGTEVANVAAHIDRINELYINLQTGATRQGQVYGDHNPRFTSIATRAVPNIDQYKSWSLQLVRVAGNARVNVCIINGVGPGNWECMIRFDDQGSDNNIAGLPGNIKGNGANMNGDTDCQVSLQLTMNR